jgi:hypothetical protein
MLKADLHWPKAEELSGTAEAFFEDAKAEGLVFKIDGNYGSHKRNQSLDRSNETVI